MDTKKIFEIPEAPAYIPGMYESPKSKISDSRQSEFLYIEIDEGRDFVKRDPPTSLSLVILDILGGE